MTPKEKADEIYNGFDMIIYTDQDHHSQVKRCSLKAVNEILKISCLKDQDYKQYFNDNTEFANYWEEVKQEINKL